MAQMTSETVVCPTDKQKDDVRVLDIRSSESAELALEDFEMPPPRVSSRTSPSKCLPHHPQGG